MSGVDAEVPAPAVKSTGDDPLAALAPMLAAVAGRDRDAEEASAESRQAGHDFLDGFDGLCASTVRPAMDAAIERLRSLGGDGLVETHPGGEARYRTPRITLWMSLEGPIVAPRQDRHPYLQFEADLGHRRVQVDEGDMWRGAGGHVSGRAGTWTLEELTAERIAVEVVAIVGRSAV